MNRKDLEGASIALNLSNVSNTKHKIQSFHSDYVLKLLLFSLIGSSLHSFPCLLFIA